MPRRWKLMAVAAVAAVLALVAASCSSQLSDSQQRRSLAHEVQQITARPFERDPGKPVILLTGSSSVRLWDDAARAFPQAQVVNTGFGGSTMAGLLEHYAALIRRYEPDQIYIGSGDNDLAGGRTPQQVQQQTEQLLARIHADLPDAEVVLIAAKPSLTRWHLRERYAELNDRYLALAEQDPQVDYADVWSALLDDDGDIQPDLYARDGLHLNSRGYVLYAQELKEHAISAH